MLCGTTDFQLAMIKKNMATDSGSSRILFGRRGFVVGVAGRSGPRVGCVDVVFDGSFSDRLGDGWF